jgi:hypothetical protein
MSQHRLYHKSGGKCEGTWLNILNEPVELELASMANRRSIQSWKNHRKPSRRDGTGWRKYHHRWNTHSCRLYPIRDDDLQQSGLFRNHNQNGYDLSKESLNRFGSRMKRPTPSPMLDCYNGTGLGSYAEERLLPSTQIPLPLVRVSRNGAFRHPSTCGSTTKTTRGKINMPAQTLRSTANYESLLREYMITIQTMATAWQVHISSAAEVRKLRLPLRRAAVTASRNA